MNKKIKILFYIVGFFLITELIDYFLISPYSQNSHSIFVDAQVNTTVSGELVDVSSLSKGLSEFVLKNTESKIQMSLYSYTYRGGQYFGHVAQPGDSVYKAKGSDTLFLFKNNKVIPFVIY